MIKFRKGSLVPKPAPNVIEATPKVAMASTPSAPAKWNPDQVVNLEWWQTPDKFKRRSVDELEIDLINVSYEKYFLISYVGTLQECNITFHFQSGGADRVYQ